MFDTWWYVVQIEKVAWKVIFSNYYEQRTTIQMELLKLIKYWRGEVCAQMKIVAKMIWK